MRIFKWSKNFYCSVESPIISVWVSLPHLLVHFIQCKTVFYSIAAAISTLLRVNHATAFVNRSSVTRVLVEYDISQPLLTVSGLERGTPDFGRILFFRRSLLIALYVGISGTVLRLLSSPTQGFAKPSSLHPQLSDQCPIRASSPCPLYTGVQVYCDIRFSAPGTY